MSVVVSTLSSAVRSVDGVSRFFSRDLPASWAQLSQSYLRAVREIEELTADSTLVDSAEQLNVLALNTAGLVGVNRQNFERAGFGERALDRVVENSEDRPRFHRSDHSPSGGLGSSNLSACFWGSLALRGTHRI